MSTILSWLEWASRYGLIDILFGIGVLGIIWRSLSKVIPRNLDRLHVHVQRGPLGLEIFLANSGFSNVYIARAWFRPWIRHGVLFKRRTRLSVSQSAAYSQAHGAYELKFGEAWLDFDVLVKPGGENRVMTYIPLTGSHDTERIRGQGTYDGTVILEYATAGFRGVHSVAV